MRALIRQLAPSQTWEVHAGCTRGHFSRSTRREARSADNMFPRTGAMHLEAFHRRNDAACFTIHGSLVRNIRRQLQWWWLHRAACCSCGTDAAPACTSCPFSLHDN